MENKIVLQTVAFSLLQTVTATISCRLQRPIHLMREHCNQHNTKIRRFVL